MNKNNLIVDGITFSSEGWQLPLGDWSSISDRGSVPQGPSSETVHQFSADSLAAFI